MSALQAVEEIAKREDRSRAFVFFLFFARFEYALKRAGYAAKSDEAKADWNAYGRAHADLLARSQEPEFQRAVAYLIQSPPKKQIIDAGQLGWTADNFAGAPDLARLLTLVCRVRNNLFHGGKFQTGVEADLSRDKALLNAGLVILQACLDGDAALQFNFMEGLMW